MMRDEHGRVCGLEDNIHVRCYQAFLLVEDQCANITDWHFEMQPSCDIVVVFERSDGEPLRVCVTLAGVVTLVDE